MNQDRKKLRKLLNKEVEWVGTVGSVGKTGENVIMLDIHSGRVNVDHVWVSRTDKLKRYPVGTEVKFRGTVISYVDSHGVRKYGLKKCYGYETNSELMEDAIKDGEARLKRIKK